MYVWQRKGVKSFQDDIGTVFTRGPFEFDGIVYDWKLEEKTTGRIRGGTDYCMESQILSWDIKMKKILSKCNED